MLDIDEAVVDAENYVILLAYIYKKLEMLELKNTDWLIVLHHGEEGDDDMAVMKRSHFSPVSFALRQWLLINISVWILVWCHL